MSSTTVRNSSSANVPPQAPKALKLCDTFHAGKQCGNKEHRSNGAHATLNPGKPPCPFFANGFCRSGVKCKNCHQGNDATHNKQTPSTVAVAETETDVDVDAVVDVDADAVAVADVDADINNNSDLKLSFSQIVAKSVDVRDPSVAPTDDDTKGFVTLTKKKGKSTQNNPDASQASRASKWVESAETKMMLDEKEKEEKRMKAEAQRLNQQKDHEDLEREREKSRNAEKLRKASEDFFNARKAGLAAMRKKNFANGKGQSIMKWLGLCIGSPTTSDLFKPSSWREESYSNASTKEETDTKIAAFTKLIIEKLDDIITNPSVSKQMGYDREAFFELVLSLGFFPFCTDIWNIPAESSSDSNNVKQKLGDVESDSKFKYRKTIRGLSSSIPFGNQIVWTVMFSRPGLPLSHYYESPFYNSLGMLKWAHENGLLKERSNAVRYEPFASSLETARAQDVIPAELYHQFKEIISKKTDNELCDGLKRALGGKGLEEVSPSVSEALKGLPIAKFMEIVAKQFSVDCVKGDGTPIDALGNNERLVQVINFIVKCLVSSDDDVKTFAQQLEIVELPCNLHGTAFARAQMLKEADAKAAATSMNSYMKQKLELDGNNNNLPFDEPNARSCLMRMFADDNLRKEISPDIIAFYRFETSKDAKKFGVTSQVFFNMQDLYKKHKIQME